VTIVAYGTILGKAIEAAEFLEEEGIMVEILNPLTLYPMDMKPIIESVIKTGCLIVAHEAVKTGGVGGESSPGWSKAKPLTTLPHRLSVWAVWMSRFLLIRN
jgi:Pyruvate/2-oxoglutarate dehydrogenase complex, dehydrogenase (E1) component, eukaryotic type, beta subunit